MTVFTVSNHATVKTWITSINNKVLKPSVKKDLNHVQMFSFGTQISEVKKLYKSEIKQNKIIKICKVCMQWKISSIITINS